MNLLVYITTSNNTEPNVNIHSIPWPICFQLKGIYSLTELTVLNKKN